jgi:hypothetical protein
MIGNLQARLAALEESTPGGYKTLDQNGATVIDSPLPTLDWMLWAKRTLQTGSPEAKATLRGQLERSVRERSGGRIFELIRVMDYGPLDVPKTTDEGQRQDVLA